MDIIYFSLYFISVYDIYSRESSSLNAHFQSIFLTSVSISSTSYPSEYRPPTSPPILVPTTISTGIPSSSRYLITPTGAAPFAPPPLSTRPTVGRCFLICSIFVRTRSNANESPFGSTLRAYIPWVDIKMPTRQTRYENKRFIIYCARPPTFRRLQGYPHRAKLLQLS